MVSKYKKCHLLLLLAFIALFCSCGGSPATKIGVTPTSSTKALQPSVTGTPRLQSTVTAQPSIVATPTPVPTPTPTPVPNQASLTTAPTGGRFTTLPPGSPLPSDADCAARVQYSSWEPRPGNADANNTNVYAQGYRLTGSYLSPYGYEQRVTGNFTGTTDEILQWAACKWGIDEDIVRAQAEQEGYWRQSTLAGCNQGQTEPGSNGCNTFGILQVKGADIPATHPGTWPYGFASTAFNVDYTYGVWRACFEGKETWLGNGYHAGDVWGCIGRWFSGNWYGGSQNYIASVQDHVATKDWLKPGF